MQREGVATGLATVLFPRKLVWAIQKNSTSPAWAKAKRGSAKCCGATVSHSGDGKQELKAQRKLDGELAWDKHAGGGTMRCAAIRSFGCNLNVNEETTELMKTTLNCWQAETWVPYTPSDPVHAHPCACELRLMEVATGRPGWGLLSSQKFYKKSLWQTVVFSLLFDN
jgi:hypothetical protein